MAEVNPEENFAPHENFVIRNSTVIKSKRQVFFTSVLSIVALMSVAVAVYIVVNNIHFTRVLSNSMAPSFHRGDVLIVKPIPKSDVKKGEVVVLNSISKDGSQYVHRLVAVKAAGNKVIVQTKGDANPVKDPWTLVIKSSEVPLVVGQLPTASVPFIHLGRSGIILALAAMLLLFISLFIPRDGLQIIHRRTRTKNTEI